MISVLVSVCEIQKNQRYKEKEQCHYGFKNKKKKYAAKYTKHKQYQFMKKSSNYCLTLLLMLASTVSKAENVSVTVVNGIDTQRQELVELNVKDIYSKLGIKDGDPFIVKNALGQQVAYQVTYDGKLLFEASVRPKGSAGFTILQGNPDPMKVYVCGRQYPERADDMAWENDRTIYRAYGPALQKTGERAFGIDVWVKNTPELEVEKRYKDELSNHAKINELKKEGKAEEADKVLKATSYHIDHGYGLDCYGVGPTLGCGTPALLKGNDILMPYCYKSYKILDNGPLRFTVRLDYNPFELGNDKNIVEHRMISLDKGSNFNKITVWYEGLTKPCDMAAGVVIHSADTTSVRLGSDYVLYADPTDNPEKQNFQIYVGVLFPNGVKETKSVMYAKPESGNAGHGIGVITYIPEEKYTYYFGSAWSKYDVRSLKEWELRSSEYMESIRNPLKVTVK